MKKYILFLTLLILISYISIAQEHTKWRGPEQNGHYPDTGLLKEWPADGPEVLWTYEDLGIGYSSPAFANNRIYLSGMEGSTGYVYALSDDGKLIWKTPYGKEFTNSYPGSRGAPVIDNDRLYMVAGQGSLVCLNANSGITIWKKDLFEELGGRNAEWGLAETPVIIDDNIIITTGGRLNNMIALNRFNGSLVWSSKGQGGLPAYCTPLLVNINGRNLLITHTADHLIGVDADNGKMLWSHSHPNRYSVHPNTPLYHDGEVFYFSGYGKGGGMLKLNADGSSVTKKWYAETMDSRIGGAVYMDGYIYGSGDENREWQCIDWKTGEVKYSTKEIGNGVVIEAEGILYLYSQRGELALVKPENNSFTIVSETKVSKGSGQHWAHPVINNGRLFVRHGNVLIAYNIKR
ncbi:PQQ-binding-like beta-propeller repeat protein [Bacteroidota bacterium]